MAFFQTPRSENRVDITLLRLLFTLRFLCVGSVQRAIFKGIITITGVADFLNE